MKKPDSPKPPPPPENAPITEALPPPSTRGSGHELERTFKAALARLANGISPAGVAALYADWFIHLALSPEKQLELQEKAVRKMMRFTSYAAEAAADPETPPCIEPLPQDRPLQKRCLAAMAL